MKKRNCRMTDEEKGFHSKAVRFRKMTDQQLVGYFDDIRRDAYKKGLSEGADTEHQKMLKIQEYSGGTRTIQQLIEALATGGCKGIKGATAFKISEFAKENGYIQ